MYALKGVVMYAKGGGNVLCITFLPSHLSTQRGGTDLRKNSRFSDFVLCFLGDLAGLGLVRIVGDRLRVFLALAFA